MRVKIFTMTAACVVGVCFYLSLVRPVQVLHEQQGDHQEQVCLSVRQGGGENTVAAGRTGIDA